MIDPHSSREQRILDLMALARQITSGRPSQQDWGQAFDDLCQQLLRVAAGDAPSADRPRGSPRLKEAARAAGAWRLAAIADRLEAALDGSESTEPFDALLGDLDRALRQTQQAPGLTWDAA